MSTKVTFRVFGVDFDDVETIGRIAEHLAELAWATVDGVTLATLFVDQEDVVSRAITTARQIVNKVPGSRIDKLDQELVAIPDISSRTGIHRETIRSWVAGVRGPGGFPPPTGSLGGGDRGSMKVWRWADVNRWLAEHYSLGDDFSYPTQAQFAEIDAYLAGAEPVVRVIVQNGSSPAFQVTHNVVIGVRP